MEKTTTLMDKLQAIKEKFIPAAEGEEVIVEEPTPAETPADPAPEEAPAEEGAAPTRAEFDKLVALVESLIEKMSPLETPSVSDQVTEQVTAQVDEIFKAIKSTDTVPTASTTDLGATETEAPEVSFLETRQKEIRSKFNR